MIKMNTVATLSAIAIGTFRHIKTHAIKMGTRQVETDHSVRIGLRNVAIVTNMALWLMSIGDGK
jgi:hypothetical protein